MNQMKIWFAASEVAPFAKTGGLADVAGSLPKALKRLNVDIRVVMPKYRQIPQEYVNKMRFLGYTYIDLAWRHEYAGFLCWSMKAFCSISLTMNIISIGAGTMGNLMMENALLFLQSNFEILPVIGFKPYNPL